MGVGKGYRGGRFEGKGDNEILLVVLGFVGVKFRGVLREGFIS